MAVGALVLSRVLASGSKGDASQPQGPDAGVASVDGEGVLEKAVERTDTERMRV